MGTRRCRVALFTVAQWEEEAAWLRRQHQKGWRFTHLTAGIFYHFEACPPEDVVYQLDYQDRGAGEDYFQLFQDCGCEYVARFTQYYYFRKPAARMPPGEEGIFCDRASRLDMIRRVFLGRVFPLIPLLAGVFLPQMVLSAPKDWVVTGLFALVLAAYLVVFLQFARQYVRLLRQPGD